MDPVSLGARQRVCEKLVLDNPEQLLSKTPEEIAAVTLKLQQGARDVEPVTVVRLFRG